MVFFKVVDRREIRYVMEASPEHGSESALDWWSAESELDVVPSARQLDRKSLIVACRATVLNETVYQRVVSLNYTADTGPSVQHVQRARPSSVSSDGQQHVSASMASSQHNSFSYSNSNKGEFNSGTTARISLKQLHTSIMVDYRRRCRATASKLKGMEGFHRSFQRGIGVLCIL